MWGPASQTLSHSGFSAPFRGLVQRPVRVGAPGPPGPVPTSTAVPWALRSGPHQLTQPLPHTAHISEPVFLFPIGRAHHLSSGTSPEPPPPHSLTSRSPHPSSPLPPAPPAVPPPSAQPRQPRRRRPEPRPAVPCLQTHLGSTLHQSFSEPHLVWYWLSSNLPLPKDPHSSPRPGPWPHLCPPSTILARMCTPYMPAMWSPSSQGRWGTQQVMQVASMQRWPASSGPGLCGGLPVPRCRPVSGKIP